MQRWGFPISGLLVVAAGVALGMASPGNNTSLPTQNHIPSAWPSFETGAVTHETESQTALPPSNVSEIPAQAQTGLPQGSVSTRSSFLASWEKANGATGYLLDVSMDSSFRSYLDGYHNKDVDLVTVRVVTGLKPGTTYYYRVRPYRANGPGNYSEASSATTVATPGLTIHATFDSSITNNPNAAAIEAMINRCISIYESLFSDPITIQILFRYTTTAPDGHPLRPGVTARSDNPFYIILWNTYIDALRADARTSNDNLANASLPGAALSTDIRPSSANGRAVGLDTPPAMFGDGTVGNGGPYDGIVTLNSGAPFEFTRPITPSNFDAQRETEHEINEVMGLGSAASVSYFHTQDLFSWSSAGQRNVSTTGTRYFSINGGVTNIVNLNQSANGDVGDWLSGACPQTHPYVQNAADCPGQSSDIAATSPEGIDLDVIGYDLNQATLGNISTRSFVQTGDDVMIGGFVIQGVEQKRLIVRAIGPELTQYGIPDVLANPTLQLHDQTGALIASNDNWQTTIIGGLITSNQVNDIQNSGHAPTAASESAIIASLQPGNYTAIVRGVSNTTGVALVEVYDLGSGITSILGNISTRSFVQTGDKVMIGGFTIQGTQPKRVIVRAIGPELTQYGITDVLADPTLELHNGNGALIGSNDNWQTTIIGGIITSNQVSDIQNSGYAPTVASESAIVANLQPGNYTAIVKGTNNTTGVALVEVYDLP